MTGPEFCEHANENPAVCRCAADCYCKQHTCKTVEKVDWSTIEAYFHRLWGQSKESPEYDKALWMKLQILLERARREAEVGSKPEKPLDRISLEEFGYWLEFRLTPVKASLASSSSKPRRLTKKARSR